MNDHCCCCSFLTSFAIQPINGKAPTLHYDFESCAFPKNGGRNHGRISSNRDATVCGHCRNLFLEFRANHDWNLRVKQAVDIFLLYSLQSLGAYLFDRHSHLTSKSVIPGKEHLSLSPHF